MPHARSAGSLKRAAKAINGLLCSLMLRYDFAATAVATTPGSLRGETYQDTDDGSEL